MRIAVPKEVKSGEKRVATTPDVVKQLTKLGYNISVEAGAGSAAKFNDNDYIDAGANIVSDVAQLWQKADIILKVRAPQDHPDLGLNEESLLKEGQTLIAFLWPRQNEELMARLAEKKVNALSVDMIPRISRAQKMDALSSMANIAGYRAIIEAAQQFGRFFTGQITAAGKIQPAKVLVIGAGVAGLSAIGTAKSMGAIVRAFDTRPEVKEQVESMDAEFLMLDFKEEGEGSGGYAKVMSKEFIEAEMALFREQAQEVDIIVTTALIPGKPAPELITEDMVRSMKEGSVIVDLAAEQGGNCKLTQADQVINQFGVTIIGYTDLPSRLANQSSQLYGTNLRHLLTDMTPDKDGELVINFDDEVVRGATITKEGEITFPPPAPKLSSTPKPVAANTPSESAPTETQDESAPPKNTLQWVWFSIAGLLYFVLGNYAPEEFMGHFTVFVLACFVGYMVIWNVTPSLHTPLMSVTNAISSIIILGALVQVSATSGWVVFLSVIAILITSVNIFGGFAVTQRMLAMFRK